VFVKPPTWDLDVGDLEARTRKKKLGHAIMKRRGFDRKIVIEQGVGGAKQKAPRIGARCWARWSEGVGAGEIVPGKEFYDYSPSICDDGSELSFPQSDQGPK